MDPGDDRAARLGAVWWQVDVEPLVLRAAVADIALLADAGRDMRGECGRGLRRSVAEGEARQQGRGPGRQHEGGIADEGQTETEQEDSFGAASHGVKLGRPAIPRNLAET